MSATRSTRRALAAAQAVAPAVAPAVSCARGANAEVADADTFGFHAEF